MSGGFPGFAEFYWAVHGFDPFPWQARLADLVAQHGWPDDIGVPTGLGKTSTIDIAVWSLAAQSSLPQDARTLPRRIWYVVDRRILVDAASDHAERLAELLHESTSGPLVDVADGLRRISAGAVRPLHVQKLRGGYSGDGPPASRPADPAQPAIICSTVAMYGSRLLFRGFGTSRSLRPIDAAHAGTDSLVLLDEAHLAKPLQRLVGLLPVSDAHRTSALRFPGHTVPTGRGPAGLLPPARAYPRLVNLTATGNPGAFDIDHDDRRHPVVQQRLRAAKPTRLVVTDRRRLPADLAATTVEELQRCGGAPAAVVFTNAPAIARSTAQHLGRALRDSADIVVLTGQLRDPDAERIRTALLDPARGAPAGCDAHRERPLVVVATQTLEVGADLDFDICVSQSAGARATVQRWGRLNRLGSKPGAAGALLHPSDDTGEGLYGDEPARVWDRLQQHGSPVNLCPDRITGLVGQPLDTPERVGELLQSHLWEFAKTSAPVPGEAPPEVFFDALDDPDRRIAVLWRAETPQPHEPIVPVPADAETVDVPVAELLTLLQRTSASAFRVGDDGITAVPVLPDDLRPGQRIVLPSSAGGYSDTGWDPDARTLVPDLSPGLRHAIPLAAAAITNLLHGPTPAAVAASLAALEFDPDAGPDPETDARQAHLLAAGLQSAGIVALAGFRNPRIERVGPDLRPLLRWDTPTPEPPTRIDSLDELSNAPRAGLTDHLAAVAELTSRIADAIGLPPEVAHAAAQAALLHDVGKADPRFQRWLGNTDGTPVAKSAMSPSEWRRAATAAGWPVGGRHELLSVQLIDRYIADGGQLSDADLVRHLVVTHHGHGRPLTPTTGDGAAITTRATINGRHVTATTDTRIPDWTQPARFRHLCETHGYWGLALLEAVVRQADHRVSAATDIEVI